MEGTRGGQDGERLSNWGMLTWFLIRFASHCYTDSPLDCVKSTLLLTQLDKNDQNALCRDVALL